MNFSFISFVFFALHAFSPIQGRVTAPGPSPPSGGGGGTGTIGNGGGSVSLPGTATVTFPQGTFSGDTKVVLRNTTDATISATFQEFTSMFRPAGRLDYEVQIEIDKFPLLDTVQVSVNVPDAFLSTVPAGYAIELFVTIEQGTSTEGYFTVFVMIPEKTDDANAKTISFDMPGNAFVENENGRFIAAIVLAPTPGGTTTRHAERGQAQKFDVPEEAAACQASGIRCPVSSGCSVNSPYSLTRKHPLTGEARPHWGVDYAAVLGEDIVAAAVGTVEKSYTSSSYGETVILRHQDGSATLYAHLNSRNVQAGDTIVLGQKLGEAGSTGISTGVHLHFEYVPNGVIIQSKNRIDPHPCVGLTVDGSLTAGDNGSLADDSFQLSIDDIVIGTTTIGGSNNLAVNNLIPGEYTLTLLVVLAPDNVGTYFVRLMNGWTFKEDGSDYRSSSLPEGGSVSWIIIVPP